MRFLIRKVLLALSLLKSCASYVCTRGWSNAQDHKGRRERNDRGAQAGRQNYGTVGCAARWRMPGISPKSENAVIGLRRSDLPRCTGSERFEESSSERSHYYWCSCNRDRPAANRD